MLHPIPSVMLSILYMYLVSCVMLSILYLIPCVMFSILYAALLTQDRLQELNDMYEQVTTMERDIGKVKG